MASNVVVFVLSFVVLVLGASAETLLPKMLGVGFPVLMTAVQFMAVRRPAVAMVLFAIAAVAAPGVMCGVLMASVGFLDTVLGFSPDQIAVLMAFYMALDGYGPAANVTGDGAVALVADRFFRREAQ